MDDRIDHRLIVIPAKWQLARQYLVEDDTQGPDVGAGPRSSPLACSGDMKATVPIVVWLFVRELPPRSLARPKSMTLAWPFPVTMMLAPFMSLWMMSLRWASPRPAATWPAILSASVGSRGHA